VIESKSTREIISLAKQDATSALGGGLEKKLNDLQSYGATAVSSGVSLGISHIPLLGPGLAKAFDLGAGAGLDKLYEYMLDNSTTRDARITNALFFLERSLAASLRQSYNTLELYDGKAGVSVEKECGDCQDAFKEARYACLAQDCVGDLEKGCKILEQLLKDLQTEVSLMKGRADQRVTNLVSRIDNFRDNHPDRTCIGTRKCYWIKGPGTPFSAITDRDLDL
jgi:hypothetical protein